MKKREFKKTYPIQYIYPNNTDIYKFVEDRYVIFEGQLDGTKLCFYNRISSVTKTTKDDGITFEEQYDNTISPSYFIAVGVDFDEIIENIIPSSDGLVEEVIEKN